jgi:hypothetical protein
MPTAMAMSTATGVAGGGGGIGNINHNRMDDSTRSGSSVSSLPPKKKPNSSHDYMLTSECGVWRVACRV